MVTPTDSKLEPHTKNIVPCQNTATTTIINKLLDEVEQNIVISQWRADQLFTEDGG